MATILVEGWFDRKLYVWSLFAGKEGTKNDLNLPEFSPLVQYIFSGKFIFKMKDGYYINDSGTTSKILYLLGDLIYPYWVIFAKPIHHPENDEARYTVRKDSILKDIERFFGILQSRSEIIRRENRRWQKEEVITISDVCVIIHNILISLVS